MFLSMLIKVILLAAILAVSTVTGSPLVKVALPVASRFKRTQAPSISMSPDGHCLVKGIYYKPGEPWHLDLGSECFTCKCFEGDNLSCDPCSFCTSPVGSRYEDGQSWYIDSCNRCTCYEGYVACDNRICELGDIFKHYNRGMRRFQRQG